MLLTSLILVLTFNLKQKQKQKHSIQPTYHVKAKANWLDKLMSLRVVLIKILLHSKKGQFKVRIRKCHVIRKVK